jgi:glycosyltransferase involved in cell wall biosynthesis
VTNGTQRLPGLSASFPAHNEEDNVGPMIADLLAALPDVADRFEIIVVDDGSRDATFARASAIAAREPRVRVVRHEINRGYGAAVWTGLCAGTLEYAFFTDGDRQFDVRQIADLIRALPGHEVVVGYRLNRQDNKVRIMNAHAWNWLVRNLFGVPVRDVDCAFKLFERRVLQGLHIESGGAMFSSELLARLAARGARIIEVPVRHLPREKGSASGGNPRVIARAFYELFRLYRKLKRQPEAGGATSAAKSS